MFQTTNQLYYSITLHHSVCLEIGPSGHGHFTLNSMSIFDKSHETSSWNGSTVFAPWKSLNIIDNMDATGNLGLIHRIDLSRIYPSIHPSRIFWGNFPGYPGGTPDDSSQPSQPHRRLPGFHWQRQSRLSGIGRGRRSVPGHVLF